MREVTRVTQCSEDSGKTHYSCVICRQKFFGYGNNPYPVKNDGIACDSCNAQVVIPARFNAILSREVNTDIR